MATNSINSHQTRRPKRMIAFKESLQIPEQSQSITMSKAPGPMRRVDEAAYIPELVCIGPFHPDKKGVLQVGKDDKERFLLRLLERGNKDGETQVKRESLNEAVKALGLKRIRECYADAIGNMQEDDIVNMMVLDGCFIIELFLSSQQSRMEFIDDPVFKTRWMLPVLKLDLVKLENQIPFFVLEELYSLIISEKQDELMTLALSFFSSLIPRSQQTPQYDEKIYQNFISTEPEHLLAIIHAMFKPKPKPEFILKLEPKPDPESYNFTTCGKFEPKSQRGHSILRACRIWARGILLKRGNGDLLDITLHNGVLKVPCLTIDRSTRHTLRNLVAYEHCNVGVEYCTTSYILFLDGLVDSPEDVAFLRHKGIISHTLGSDEEVTALINSLTKEVVHYEDDCFICRLDKVMKPNWWRIILLMLSFSEFIIFAILHPGNFITVILTLAALYLGVIQTVLTIMSLVRN